MARNPDDLLPEGTDTVIAGNAVGDDDMDATFDSLPDANTPEPKSAPKSSGPAEPAPTMPKPAAKVVTAKPGQTVTIEMEQPEPEPEPEPVDPSTINVKNFFSAFGDQASTAKGEATDQLRAFALQGKDRATEGLDRLIKMVSDAATTVEDKVGPQYATYVRQAAERLEGLSGAIRDKDVDALFEDARGLIRQSPNTAIGIAATVGFAAARVLKAGMDAAAASPVEPPVAK